MGYEAIDSVIFAWAAKHTLYVYRVFRDVEVRNVVLFGSSGQKCQIWIDSPDQSEEIQVHVWDYEKRRKDFKVAANDLSQCLELAYDTAMEWLL